MGWGESVAPAPGAGATRVCLPEGRVYFGGPPALGLDEFPDEGGVVELLLPGVGLGELRPLGDVRLGGDCLELLERCPVSPGLGRLMEGDVVVSGGFAPSGARAVPRVAAVRGTQSCYSLPLRS